MMRLKCWLLVLVLAPLCGCSGPEASCRWSSVCWPNCYVPFVDDCKVKVRAKCLANDALERLDCGTPSCHFREGFIQAYVDIAQGSDGLIPATPPQRYWGMMFRNEPGHARAQEWFHGYSVGVDSATSEGLSNFNWVNMSTASSGGADVVEPEPLPAY